MRMTRGDYEARVARLADGTSPDPDDDRRLVKMYESPTAVVEFLSDPQPVGEPVDEKPQRRTRNARR